MNLLVILIVVLFSGCSTYGDYVDRNDPCLKIGKPTDYVFPELCKNRTVYKESSRLNKISSTKYGRGRRYR